MRSSLRAGLVALCALSAFVACGSDDEGGGGTGGKGTGGSATGGSGGAGGGTGGSTGGSGGGTAGSGGGTAGSGGGTAGSGGSAGASGGTGGASGGTGGASGGTGGASGGTGGASGGTGGASGGTGGASGGTGGTSCGATPPALKLTTVGTSVGSGALYVTSPPGDTQRLFVVRQSGQIRIIKSGTNVATPFLDITSIVQSGGERGLLGLAFHPQYASNGRFFVYYTQNATPVGDIVIAEYKVSSNPDVAGTTQVQKLIQIGHSQNSNHNGGMLEFGPDGYLYAGIGDGGGGGDPFKAGQSLTTHLGKILRLNQDAPTASLPGNQTGLIWDWGLRNPWRFSFDRSTGDLYIADVGQNQLEEINFEPKGAGKKNYGWSVMEGTKCYGSATCNQTGLTLPVHEYTHSDGCSVTGGYVYRGNAIPCLKGWYLYGDYCTGTIWGLRVVNGAAQNNTKLSITQTSLSSFGEDANGELYVTSGSSVKRIDAN